MRGNRSNYHVNNQSPNWHNAHHYHHNQRHQSSSVASHESTNCTPESSTHSDDQMDSSAKRLSPQQFLNGNNLSDEVHQFQDEYPTLSTPYDLKKNNTRQDLSSLSTTKKDNENEESPSLQHS